MRRVVLNSDIEILEMSDIWIRKIRTFFRKFDFDSDGVIHRKEFVHIPERIGDLEMFDPAQTEIARKRCDDVSGSSVILFATYL